MKPVLGSFDSEDSTDSVVDDRIESILGHTIEAINVAEALMPLEMVKGVLSSISGVLELVKASIDNKKDFLQIAEQCKRISVMICQATAGSTEMNPVLESAINELQSYMDAMLEVVQAKIQSHIGSRLFHASVNKDRILDWQKDLDRVLILFNTQLSIASNITVESLASRLDEFKDFIHLDGDRKIPVTVPPKPPLFVGRSEIVQTVTEKLLDLESVALIATGGMGKTYIARAILHQPKVIQKFRQRRFFVQYDDIDASQITLPTFLSRLARRLGISASRENLFPFITMFLESDIEPALIVFDNAETFVDEGQDSGGIAECINSLGALENVAILATSRSTTLPTNLVWERYHVLPLEDAPAAELFHRIYKPDFPAGELTTLLKSLDNHPLSINLLAQVAIQNDWAPINLLDAWKNEHTSLLDTGHGKSQSLAVTISLTLQSPSLLKYGDILRYIIHTVAFFPQGIKRESLEEIFNDTPEAGDVINALNKHCLTRAKGDFITMLAPIRLHFLADIPLGSNNIPIPDQIYQFYMSRLGDPNALDAQWVSSEDINIEHFFSVSLRHCKMCDFVNIAAACVTYLEVLADNKPRPTALRRVIRDIEYHQDVPTSILHSSNRKMAKRIHFYKGRCILALALLLLQMGDTYEAGKLVEEGIRIVELSGIAELSDLRKLPLMVAVGYLQVGDFHSAEEKLEMIVQKPSRLKLHIGSKATLWTSAAVMLECARVILGKSNNRKELIKLLSKMKYDTQDGIEHYAFPHAIRALTIAAPWVANPELPGIVKDHYHKLVNAIPLNCHFAGLVMSANIALREDSLVEADQLLQKARPLRKAAELEDRISYFQMLAAYRVKSGMFPEARAAIHALTKATFLGNLMASTVVPYMNGWIDLHERNLAPAKKHFKSALDLAETSSDLVATAIASRAVGEIEYLQQNWSKVVKRFSRVVETFEKMGTRHETIFNHGWITWSLDAGFNGWPRYLEDSSLSSTN